MRLMRQVLPSIAIRRLRLATATAGLLPLPLGAQLLCYDGFGDYPAGSQVESGSNGSTGTGLDGGTGWGGAYDTNNFTKSLIRIEDRTATPVNYSNGEIIIGGGTKALRFYDVANGNPALQRPLGTTFSAAAGEPLWFSLLFRTNNASLLANQDFFQIGFDDNAGAAAGIPRVSIGANTTSTTTFPSPFQFFARSTTAVNASAFAGNTPIATATTYLLVGLIQPNAGVYDTVSLYVNPSTLEDPGPASASVTLSSGLTALSHLFVRTVNLDNGDAYVVDELRLGRDYGSIVLPTSLRDALRFIPPAPPGGPFILQWSTALTGVVLETSTTLAADSWMAVPGPFSVEGENYHYPVPMGPGISRGFYRLKR